LSGYEQELVAPMQSCRAKEKCQKQGLLTDGFKLKPKKQEHAAKSKKKAAKTPFLKSKICKINFNLGQLFARKQWSFNTWSGWFRGTSVCRFCAEDTGR
jgi:hypothetical protein